MVSSLSCLSATENPDEVKTQSRTQDEDDELTKVYREMRLLKKGIELYRVEVWFLNLMAEKLIGNERLEVERNANATVIRVGLYSFTLAENDAKMMGDHIYGFFDPADRAVALKKMKETYGASTDSPAEISMILLQKKIPAAERILEILQSKKEALLTKICGPFRLAGFAEMEARSRCIRRHCQKLN